MSKVNALPLVAVSNEVPKMMKHRVPSQFRKNDPPRTSVARNDSPWKTAASGVATSSIVIPADLATACAASRSPERSSFVASRRAMNCGVSLR
ncbi:MAG TPA: hypothetical protein VFQ96_06600 [Microbacteriaceae bacterium]|nr:hypothetical protein [Microbacteriaceae bacterium]